MRDRNSDGPCEGRAKRGKWPVPFSLSRRPPSSTPIPGSHNNGHHVATKAKHPKYWWKSRHSVAVNKWGKTRGYRALLNISLGSNLSRLVHVILLHGQTVIFLALNPSIVESFVIIEREGFPLSLSLSFSRSQALPLQLPFYSTLSELRVSLSVLERDNESVNASQQRRLVRLTPKRGVRCASLGVKDRAAVNTNGTPPRVVVAASATLSSGSSARRREHSVKAPLVNSAPRTVIDGKSRCWTIFWEGALQSIIAHLALDILPIGMFKILYLIESMQNMYLI